MPHVGMSSLYRLAQPQVPTAHADGRDSNFLLRTDCRLCNWQVQRSGCIS